MSYIIIYLSVGSNQYFNFTALTTFWLCCGSGAIIGFVSPSAALDNNITPSGYIYSSSLFRCTFEILCSHTYKSCRHLHHKRNIFFLTVKPFIVFSFWITTSYSGLLFLERTVSGQDSAACPCTADQSPHTRSARAGHGRHKLTHSCM